MSFQRFDSEPSSDEQQTQSKRPHLSVFRFASFQSTSRTPSHAPPAYSPDDVLAVRNQLHTKLLAWIRIALATFTLGVSIAVIVCAASALRTYSGTRYTAEWVLPLWPTSVDLRPSHAVLACGVVLTVMSLVYLIVALAPTPLNNPRSLNLVATILAFISLFMTIFTTIFASTINNHLSNSTEAGTLVSWTCKWRGFGNAAPVKFGEICSESMAASDMIILMIVTSAFSVLLAGLGWLVEARGRRVGGGKAEQVAA